MVGSECPTSMVGGISRSGTSLRTLNQAMVVANEPMPSVSKKFVIAPITRDSALGRARLATTARSSMIVKASIARPSGTKSAISMATPLAPSKRHCEPAPAGAAIQLALSGLLRRFAPRNDESMLPLDDQQQAARDWFE